MKEVILTKLNLPALPIHRFRTISYCKMQFALMKCCFPEILQSESHNKEDNVLEHLNIGPREGSKGEAAEL